MATLVSPYPAVLTFSRITNDTVTYDQIRADWTKVYKMTRTKPFGDLKTNMAMSRHLEVFPDYSSLGTTQVVWVQIEMGVKGVLESYYLRKQRAFQTFLLSNPYCTIADWFLLRLSQIHPCLICLLIIPYLICSIIQNINVCFCRGWKGERDWLEATMTANPELDGKEIDRLLHQEMRSLRDRYNDSFRSLYFEYSYSANQRVVTHSTDSEGHSSTDVSYRDVYKFIVTRRPANLIVNTPVETPVPAPIVRAEAEIPVAAPASQVMIRDLEMQEI